MEKVYPYISKKRLDEVMHHCIDIAKKGPDVLGAFTDSDSGNQIYVSLDCPLVGAVVLDENGDIISEGYRHIIPQTTIVVHAERATIQTHSVNEALKKKKELTLITTLQPCSLKYENQIIPCCSSLIIDSKLPHVVYGLRDEYGSKKHEIMSTHLAEHGISLRHLVAHSERITQELMSPRPYVDHREFNGMHIKAPNLKLLKTNLRYQSSRREHWFIEDNTNSNYHRRMAFKHKRDERSFSY